MIEINAVSKVYGDIVALKDITLSINSGELVSIIGPSGAGKTTLVRILCGEEAPSAGNLKIRGVDVCHLPQSRRGVAVVYQHYSLFPHMSVFENVAFPLKARSAIRFPFKTTLRERESLDGKVNDLLEKVELGAHSGKLPNQLSGGEQQRAAIARALGMSPDLICFDEPFSALDIALRRRLRERVAAIKRDSDNAFLYVTHNIDDAFVLSDRIAVLIAGNLVQVDTPKNLYLCPVSSQVAELTGDVSFVTVDQVRPTPAGAVVRTSQGTEIVYKRSHPRPGATVGIRPESIKLGQDCAMVFSRITDIRFEGATTRISLSLPGGEALLSSVHSAYASVYAVGDEIGLNWDYDFSVNVDKANHTIGSERL